MPTTSENRLTDGLTAMSPAPSAVSQALVSDSFRIDVPSPASGRPHDGVEVQIVAGPDAGRSLALDPGRHLVGRAAGVGVRIDDPALEPHHALITVGVDGTARVTQLAGRFPVLVDGAHWTTGRVGHGAVVELGMSRVVLGERRRGGSVDRFSVLAEVERECYLARRANPWVVSIGHGAVRLELPLEQASLSMPEHAAATRAELHPALPVLVDLARCDRFVLAVRGTVARRAIAAIVRQLDGAGAQDRPGIADRRWVVASDPREWGSVARRLTVLVAVAAAAEPPAGCDALLDIGTNWRASYTADLIAPDVPVRLHAAGCPHEIADSKLGA